MAERGRHAEFWAALKAWISVSWLPAALIVVAFYVAAQYIKPAPPKELTILAGSAQGSYYRHALRFKEALAEQGVEVTVAPSTGSVANLSRLRRAAPETPVVAFVQSGIAQTHAAGSEDTTALMSLGSLFAEPVWMVSRTPIKGLRDLTGRQVAVGPEGSGTRMLAEQLFALTGLDAPQAVNRHEMAAAAALQALQSGQLDAMITVAGPDAPIVARLLHDPSLHVLDWTRAKAFARRLPYLSVVDVPPGALDLARDVPAQALSLIAPTANLVARDDLHPGMVDLLLLTIDQLYGEATLLTQAGYFPSGAYADPALSDAARRFYAKGPSFLQRYLPFWAATWVDRLLVLLLPLLTVTLPLIRVMPPVYRWRVRKKIYRWYRTLMDIEARILANADSQEKLTAELEELAEELSDLTVPLSYADELYTLKVHVKMVSDQLGRSSA